MDLIADSPVGQRAPGKSVASGQLDKQEILTQLPLAELQANEERQGNLLQEYEERFERLSEDQKLSRVCSEAGLRLIEVGQFFLALPSPRGKENQSLCRESSMPRNQEGTRITHCGRYSIEVKVQTLFQDQTVSWSRIVKY